MCIAAGDGSSVIFGIQRAAEVIPDVMSEAEQTLQERFALTSRG